MDSAVEEDSKADRSDSPLPFVDLGLSYENDDIKENEESDGQGQNVEKELNSSFCYISQKECPKTHSPTHEMSPGQRDFLCNDLPLNELHGVQFYDVCQDKSYTPLRCEKMDDQSPKTNQKLSSYPSGPYKVSTVTITEEVQSSKAAVQTPTRRGPPSTHKEILKELDDSLEELNTSFDYIRESAKKVLSPNLRKPSKLRKDEKPYEIPHGLKHILNNNLSLKELRETHFSDVCLSNAETPPIEQYPNNCKPLSPSSTNTPTRKTSTCSIKRSSPTVSQNSPGCTVSSSLRSQGKKKIKTRGQMYHALLQGKADDNWEEKLSLKSGSSVLPSRQTMPAENALSGNIKLIDENSSKTKGAIPNLGDQPILSPNIGTNAKEISLKVAQYVPSAEGNKANSTGLIISEKSKTSSCNGSVRECSTLQLDRTASKVAIPATSNMIDRYSYTTKQAEQSTESIKANSTGLFVSVKSLKETIHKAVHDSLYDQNKTSARPSAGSTKDCSGSQDKTASKVPIPTTSNTIPQHFYNTRSLRNQNTGVNEQDTSSKVAQHTIDRYSYNTKPAKQSTEVIKANSTGLFVSEKSFNKAFKDAFYAQFKTSSGSSVASTGSVRECSTAQDKTTSKVAIPTPSNMIAQYSCNTTPAKQTTLPNKRKRLESVFKKTDATQTKYRKIAPQNSVDAFVPFESKGSKSNTKKIGFYSVARELNTSNKEKTTPSQSQARPTFSDKHSKGNQVHSVFSSNDIRKNQSKVQPTAFYSSVSQINQSNTDIPSNANKMQHQDSILSLVGINGKKTSIQAKLAPIHKTSVGMAQHPSSSTNGTNQKQHVGSQVYDLESCVTEKQKPRDEKSDAIAYWQEIRQVLKKKSFNKFLSLIGNYRKTRDLSSVVSNLKDLFIKDSSKHHLFRNFYTYILPFHKKKFESICQCITGQGCGFKPEHAYASPKWTSTRCKKSPAAKCSATKVPCRPDSPVFASRLAKTSRHNQQNLPSTHDALGMQPQVNKHDNRTDSPVFAPHLAQTSHHKQRNLLSTHNALGMQPKGKKADGNKVNKHDNRPESPVFAPRLAKTSHYNQRNLPSTHDVLGMQPKGKKVDGNKEYYNKHSDTTEYAGAKSDKQLEIAGSGNVHQKDVKNDQKMNSRITYPNSKLSDTTHFTRDVGKTPIMIRQGDGDRIVSQRMSTPDSQNATPQSASNILESMREELTCAICTDELEEPKELICRHLFCKTCLQNWLKSKENQTSVTCPVCQQDTPLQNKSIDDLQTNMLVKNLAQHIRLAKVQNSQSQCESKLLSESQQDSEALRKKLKEKQNGLRISLLDLHQRRDKWKECVDRTLCEVSEYSAHLVDVIKTNTLAKKQEIQYQNKMQLKKYDDCEKEIEQIMRKIDQEVSSLDTTGSFDASTAAIPKAHDTSKGIQLCDQKVPSLPKSIKIRFVSSGIHLQKDPVGKITGKIMVD